MLGVISLFLILRYSRYRKTILKAVKLQNNSRFMVLSPKKSMPDIINLHYRKTFEFSRLSTPANLINLVSGPTFDVVGGGWAGWRSGEHSGPSRPPWPSSSMGSRLRRSRTGGRGGRCYAVERATDS
jgi:hypothetical protein